MAKTKTRIVLPYNLTCNLKDICPSAEFLGINHMHDYALCYRDGMLTAENKKGHIVDTPVYMIDADEEKHLDKKICSPGVKKSELTVSVIIDGRTVKRKALMYVMDSREPLSLPTPEYLRLCAEALAHVGIEFIPIFDAYIETRQTIMNKADA
jgi:gamma-glutamylcyclotransferase (GGCT)/AIG2-like uncharacterized protein YtfP